MSSGDPYRFRQGVRRTIALVDGHDDITRMIPHASDDLKRHAGEITRRPFAIDSRIDPVRTRVESMESMGENRNQWGMRHQLVSVSLDARRTCNMTRMNRHDRKRHGVD